MIEDGVFKGWFSLANPKHLNALTDQHAAAVYAIAISPKIPELGTDITIMDVILGFGETGSPYIELNDHGSTKPKKRTAPRNRLTRSHEKIKHLLEQGYKLTEIFIGVFVPINVPGDLLKSWAVAGQSNLIYKWGKKHGKPPILNWNERNTRNKKDSRNTKHLLETEGYEKQAEKFLICQP